MKGARRLDLREVAAAWKHHQARAGNGQRPLAGLQGKDPIVFTPDQQVGTRSSPRRSRRPVRPRSVAS